MWHDRQSQLYTYNNDVCLDNEIIPVVSIQFQNIENFLITNTR